MRKSQTLKLFVALFIIAVVAAFAVAAQAGAEQIPLAVLVFNALEFLAVALCSAIAVLALVWFFDWEKKNPSYGALETSFRVFLNNRRKALAQRNAAQIIPALQPFFYLVLRRNKNILGIDSGPDCGSLSPNGRAVTFRNNAIFYIFELVLSAAPEQDVSVLKQLINQFIFAELINYGVANLSSTFTTSKGQTFPSVYLDRLSYDDVRHVLIFELLFVGSDQAATALEKALERDKPQAPKAEIDVFDDEC